jgi:beta-glucosidase
LVGKWCISPWTYDSLQVTGATVQVRLRNTGDRPGREVVQLYLAPAQPDRTRPARWLAGFATVEAAPGARAEATVELPRRAFEVWDETTGTWSFVKGSYELQAGRSITDRRITAPITV